MNEVLDKDNKEFEKKQKENEKKEIIQIVIKELQERNLIHEVKNSYANTEYILSNFDSLKKSIKDIEHQIDDLKTYGLQKSGKAAVVIGESNVIKIEEDKIIEDRINELRQSKHRTQAVINMVNSILNDLKQDEYYEIIKLRYFDDLKIEEIAEKLDCSDKTIRKHRKRLINTIKIRLFPNTVISELGY